ncbi:response regulator [Pseudomonas sp. B14-6]|uniref:response regulator n=1 Tax=Pseudomonas sp. B14-6 TaxID=2738843 RepID=UPI00155E1FCF|nr:response regulator [Pseudomonas sp. B14-6]QKG67073.1 response regulator [Pseudomonas sp. B14-6]
MIVSRDLQLSIEGDVIIVEDDDLLSNLMMEILSDIGAGCLAFDTADDALIHLLQSHRACSLVIADHGVPGQILGTDLAKMVKEKWPEIAVILTSGHELKVSDLPSNVRYLQKPWAIDSLVSTVREVLHPHGRL